MPTYDYVCSFCDHAFEHFQGIHDALLRKCPECGRHGLKRKFGVGAGVVFKGSGFYETDYKRKGEKGDEPSSDKSSGASEKEAAKPAAKSEDGKASGESKNKSNGDKGGKGSDAKPT